jgi:uncharacterized protein (DUF885 family)
MGCCRAITDQLSAVEQAKARLCGSRGLNHYDLANAVTTNLDTCRQVLGTYQVSRRLTTEFRQEIEPDLANVWTAKDLDDYASRLNRFSSVLKQALVKWRQRYCKEALSA